MARERGAVRETLLRYDIRPEDVLDEETLDEMERRQDQAEADAPSRIADESAADNALTVDDLRELAERVRRGEHITLQKP